MDKQGFILREEQKEKRSYFALILSVFTAAGLIFCTQKMFVDTSWWGVPIAVSMGISFVVFLAYYHGKKWWILCGTAALLCVLVFCFRAAFLAGAADFINQIVANINWITGESYLYFVVPAYENMEIARVIFLCLTAGFLTMYLGAAIGGKHWLPVVIFWLPLIFAAVFFEMPRMAWCAGAFAFVSVAGTYAYAHTKVTEEKNYVCAFAVIAVLVSVVSLTALKLDAYKPSQVTAQLKETISDQMNAVKYGAKDLPEGKIAQGIRKSDEERLILTAGEKGKYYLKGYVGSVYKDNRWEPLDGKAYGDKYEGMFEQYEKDGFHPLSQLYRCYDAMKQQNGQETTETDIEIENVGAYKKYIYLPYGVDFETLEKTKALHQDLNLTNRFTEKATNSKAAYKAYVIDIDSFLKTFGVAWDKQQITEQSVQNYVDLEKDYRNFAYNHYLTISKEDETEVSSYVPEEKEDLVSFTETLRKSLKQAGKPEKWDALQYTSLGTLAFRAAGIPARYVEGYEAVTGEEKTAAGKYTAHVTARQAHAWIEIYCDGVGWLPIDVTPGHYDKITAKAKTQKEIEKQQVSTTQKVSQKQEGKEKRQENSVNLVGVVFAVVAVVILLIVLAAAALMIRRQVIRRNRKKVLMTGETNEVYRFLISYLAELLSYLKISEEEMPEDIRSGLQRYWFATENAAGVTDKEVTALQQYGNEIQNKMRQEASLPKRIMIRFWYCFEFPFLEEGE